MKKPLLFTVLPVLMLVSVVVLGVGCVKEQETILNTNTNGVVEDSNAANTNEAETNVNKVETTNNANVSIINAASEGEDDSNLDTSDWLTYTNEEYGFSFRYPDSLALKNDLQEQDYFFALVLKTKAIDPVSKLGDSIFFFGVPKDKQVMESKINSFIGVERKNIIINNISAIQYTYFQGMEENTFKPHNTKRIFINKNNIEFEIIQVNYNANDEYDDWFNKIVDSLIFF